MTTKNLEEIIQKILDQSEDLSRKEIEERISAKIEELNNLVTEVGAAHIVAKELGIQLVEVRTRPSITIKELQEMGPGPGNIFITGRIKRVYEKVSFKRKERIGTVQNLVLVDNTGELRVVLWGGHTKKIEAGNIARGDILRIIRGYLREGFGGKGIELHVGTRSDLQINPEGIRQEDFPDISKFTAKFEDLDEFVEKEVDIEGIVSYIGKLSTFSRGEGEPEGKVGWLGIADSEGSSRLVFWNDRAELIFNYSEGDKIQIEGGTVRLNREEKPEIHIGKRTRISKHGRAPIPPHPFGTTEVQEVTCCKIEELKPALGQVTFSARVGVRGDLSEFTRNDGSLGAVARLIVFDETGAVPIVLWDDHARNISDYTIGSPITIVQGFVRERYDRIEVSVGREGEIISSQDRDLPQQPPSRKITDLKEVGELICADIAILRMGQINTFQKQDGEDGKVLSATVGDETGQTRLVAWGEDVETLEKVRNEEAVHIQFGRTVERESGFEIHLTKMSQLKSIKDIPENLKGLEFSDYVSSTREYIRKPIQKIEEDEFVKIRARITRVFGKERENMFYMACPLCRRKAAQEIEGKFECREHGTVEAIPMIIVSMIIDDGTETARLTCIGEMAEKFIDVTGKEIYESEDPSLIETIQQKLEGQSYIFFGRTSIRTTIQEDKEIESVDIIANRIIPVNPKTEAMILFEELAEITGISS
ncbi:MAG: OB-fold nucleic acid binding domain-containing protein [Promethearchaeota archaeon]